MTPSGSLALRRVHVTRYTISAMKRTSRMGSNTLRQRMMHRADLDAELQHPESLLDVCQALAELHHLSRRCTGVGHQQQLAVEQFETTCLSSSTARLKVSDCRLTWIRWARLASLGV